MRKNFSTLAVAALVALLTAISCGPLDSGSLTGILNPHVTDSVNKVQRGRYLVTIMGCDDCHSPKKFGPKGPEIDSARRLSGFQANHPLPAFDASTARNWLLFYGDLTAAVGPWGVTFAANITSDATGIGNWTEAQFIRCLREGKWKGLQQARSLLPPMPWQNFSKLTDRDLRSIYAFLKTTKPVNNAVPQPVPPTLLNPGGR